MRYLHVSHEPAPDQDGKKMVRVSTYRNPDPEHLMKAAMKRSGKSARQIKKAIREGRQKAKGKL